MDVEELVANETRTRPRTAVFAGAAAILLLLGPVFQIVGPHTSVNEVTLGLIMTHKRFPLDLIAAVLDTFGWLALTVTLWRLQASVEVRTPKPRRWLRWVVCVGGLFYAIPPTVLAIKSAVAASAFVSSGAQTYVQAHALVTGGVLLPASIVAYYLGQFMLAGSFIMVALGAMRVGLLPRNLGFVGIAGGVFVLVPIFGIPIITCFWAGALATLLLGRWPSGIPMAWSAGIAVPWEPSARGMRTAPAPAVPKAPSPWSGLGRKRSSVPEPEPEAAAPAPQIPERTRANTSKRKRKHR